jgi:hypothetical protein
VQTAPLRLHHTFLRKLRNFSDENYTFAPHQHITKLMAVLVEDAGVGQLHKIQTVARLAESLGGTQFSELDYFYGSFLKFSRLPDEMYGVDPFSDQLTAVQWRDVEKRDAQYRERISLFLQAILRGGTNEGLSMAAHAACGYPCTILELWRYNDSQGLATDPGRIPGSAKEMVVVPKIAQLSNSRRRAIYTTLNRLKPADTVVTVDERGLVTRRAISIRHVASPSEYFEVRRYVTGADLPPPPADTRYFWVKDGVEIEAPSFAHLQTQEARWQHNNAITHVDSFTIGPDGTSRYTIPPLMKSEASQWGPWRLVETADSPDNFPNGKYPGDAARYGADGRYLFAWTNQIQYVRWLRQIIETMGGDFADSRYRLPITAEVTAGEESSPDDALAAMRVKVESLYYVQ